MANEGGSRPDNVDESLQQSASGLSISGRSEGEKKKSSASKKEKVDSAADITSPRGSKPKSSGIPSTPKTPNKSSSNKTKPSPGKSSRTPRGGKEMLKRRKSRKKKKGITFKKTVGVHTIPNLDTYSILEKEVYWYGPDEYGQMEDECDLTADTLDRRKPLFPGHCARGLEAWTLEGEQRKEGHVQLAVDIVWQAQLDQWKASSDINECWEFIRSRYLAVSKPCHKIAHKRGLSDESEIKSYLAGVRSVEKNRQRVMGIHKRSTPKIVNRKRNSLNANDKPAVGSPGSAARNVLPSSQYDADALKGLLKETANGKEHEREGKKIAAAGTPISAGKKKAQASPGDDDIISVTSSKASARKIAYKPKSRSKVPVSPVASMVSMDNSDENSLSRRMRSHMSVTSEDSTRRRMLRTANLALKPL